MKTAKKNQWQTWGKEWAEKHPEEMRAYRRKWQKGNRDKVRKYARDNYKRNIEKYRKFSRELAAKVKQEVLDHYGQICVCCGETEYRFLSVDHVKNDGAQHRKEAGVKGQIYKWLKKNGFPKGFQILCYNCNLAKGFYGECPHKKRYGIE